MRSKSEFVQWCLYEVHEREKNPTLILFSDAAWIDIGYVNF